MSGQDPTRKTGHLRPLLPANARRPGPLLATAPQSRANSVVSACNECRKQKTRCSGGRPACGRCVEKHIQCHYSTQPGERHSHALKRSYRALEDRTSAYEEFFETLKKMPNQESWQILQKIKAGIDIKTILDQIKAGDILLQMAVVPEARFRYEFPYKAEMPEDYIKDNPYLDSLIFEATSLFPKDRSTIPSMKSKPSLARTLKSHQHQNLYLKPFHAAEVIEPQLSNVKPSLWTTVCDDDVLMRDLLSVFFRCEYHFTAAFQKDLFLEDMAAQRQDFCSPLLVNVVLAYACVCYPRFQSRAEYWNPHTLVYRFLAEAKRIWELVAPEPRITTIQAGIVFNAIHNLCGLDEIGQAYRIHAIALAHEFGLFGSNVAVPNHKMEIARAFTAWALFNWETLVGFSFLFPPLLKVRPDWRLPDPSKDAQFYGEIWVKYPLSDTLVPSYFGHVFLARSRFRIIMNKYCQEAFSEGCHVTAVKADEFRNQLQHWYDNLPKLLQPNQIALPGHLQLHLYYHHLILTIYEPLLDEVTELEPTPQKIIQDARKYLQTLIRLYYLRHGYEAMDLFIVIPLMVAGVESLNAIETPSPGSSDVETLRSTLFLVAKGLYDQRRNHYLAEALYRVVRGRMRQEEWVLFSYAANLEHDERNEKQEMTQTVRSRWPVSVVKKKEEIDSHILTNLVESYAHLEVAAVSR